MPEKVGGVFICVSPDRTEEIVKEAVQSGIKNIWLQQGAQSAKAILYCRENKLNLVYGECILMFAEPVGFPHSVHRFLWKMIGKYPK
ncbi:CoA-binding protein [Thermanaerosceptrum fracticalcis]|uniref:CoA-binding protein n=1 Tax=Thermanaerosceptrum fracticalcis TaxID=1712410 RepID=UPI001FAD3BA5|nr:CoA-binding protein [Thermanaerosceptrum fracticalcis]